MADGEPTPAQERETDSAEGGWAVAVSGAAAAGGRGALVVASHDKWIFWGRTNDTALQSTDSGGKAVRCISFWSSKSAIRTTSTKTEPVEPEIVITTGDDKVIEARCPETMKILHKTEPLSKKVARMEAYDAATILFCDKTGDAYTITYDPAQGFGSPKLVLGHTASMITGLAVCYDGKLIATTDKDGHLRLTRYPDTGIIEKFCLGHTAFVAGLSQPFRTFTDPACMLATAGGDGMVKVWRVPSGEEVFSHSFGEDVTVHDVAVLYQDPECTIASAVCASVEGVGIVAFDVSEKGISPPRTVSATPRAPVTLAAGGQPAHLFAAYIGEEAPFFESYLVAGGAAGEALHKVALELPVDIKSVKPSYWQVELLKKRSLNQGIGTRFDLQTKKKPRTDES
ncbi:tRNA (guanine-N(7)-)-methyltransferase non-catalytic subunit wuho [Diplonema papillatum]|nr:tRNA (guanine-N(7)-)-methyltransferase non-catalytic subunit wuho [Diplonema papillatum]